MNEKRLWDYISNNVSHLGHFSRVETHETSAGYPDVSYCIDGHTNHVELKAAEIGKKPLRLRPSQSAWFRARVKAGGKPFLLYAYERKDELVFGLIKGVDVPDLVKTSKFEKWLAVSHKVWYGEINWHTLLKELTTH